MAWVELVPFGLILLLVAWIFLRPYPGDRDEKKPEERAAEEEAGKGNDEKDV